ncbi:MAG: heavy-metal-associated domain-containing protein [Nitrospiria bacterium]
MKCTRSILIIAVFLSFSVPYANAGTRVRIKLMLGGKFCGEYTIDVEKAIKDVDGVKSVDLKSMKGHVLVEIDPDKVKSSQLVDAVKAVKGEGWHCNAELMRETGKLYRL